MEELVFEVHYKSVKDIPRDEYKNLFKQYWTFIARNHLDYKPTIVNKDGQNLYIISNCFACKYSIEKHGMACWVCPLKLYRSDRHDCLCIDTNTPYELWVDTKSPRWAMEIAQLEWED